MELTAFQQADGRWLLKSDGGIEEPAEPFPSQEALVAWLNEHPETGSASLQWELWAGPPASATIEAEPASAGAGEEPSAKKTAAKKTTARRAKKG